MASEDKKPDVSFRHYFQFLKRRERIPIEEYDVERHGTLVDAKVPGTYDVIDQYWVEAGCSIVAIAHNKKTNQSEYLLFEPDLPDFEYELMEHLHEDLRDVLIISAEEMKKDRKRILLEMMQALIGEYGLTLEMSSRYKIQYFLIRNYIGWSRIDP